MPQQNFEQCHKVVEWADVNFEHQKTGFVLTGKHATPDCRSCHFKQEENQVEQHFQGLTKDCENCHQDPHRTQFQVDGTTNCANCHRSDAWKPSSFDHGQSRFKLDGQHAQTACVKCHPLVEDQEGTFAKYKLKTEIKCADCHY